MVRATEGMFLEIAKKVAKDYPGIQMDDANVDAICMWLLKNPKSYGVMVATNLFGDIISDLSAQLVGGLGFGCSGNIGEKLAVFEPSHGSAPKYAGQYKVNPIATILAAKMMLDWLGEAEMGRTLEAATAAVIAGGQGPHLRHGRRRHHPGDGRSHRPEALAMGSIVIHEVGPRDGLQVERRVVPTEVKEAWIRGLMALRAWTSSRWAPSSTRTRSPRWPTPTSCSAAWPAPRASAPCFPAWC